MTPTERDAVCDWLDKRIMSSELVIKQFANMQDLKEFIAKEARELTAMKITVELLRSIEDQEVG